MRNIGEGLYCNVYLYIIIADSIDMLYVELTGEIHKLRICRGGVMPDKTRVDVLIAGKTFSITGYESDEYIQRVGLYVDRKMNEVLRSNNTLSTTIAAILTALNVADDYFKAHENELAFKKEIVSSKLEIEKLLDENNTLEERNKELIEKNNNVLIEIAKREAELAEIRSNLSASREKRY